jgi:hypothetical protein
VKEKEKGKGKKKGNRGDGVEGGRVGRAVIRAVKYRAQHQETALRPDRKFNGGQFSGSQKQITPSAHGSSPRQGALA